MESINLIGADDVRQAGYTMKYAAEEMKQAVTNFEYALEAQRRFMDDWLQRLEAAMNKEPLNKEGMV